MSDINLHDRTYLESVVEREGSVTAASRELGIPRTTLRRRLGLFDDTEDRVRIESPDKIEDTQKGDHRTISSKGQVRSAEELLQSAGVDLNEWLIEKQVVNSWDAMARQEDGTTAPKTMYQVKVWLARRFNFDIKPPKFRFRGERRPSKAVKSSDTVLCIPDAQFGFRRLQDGSLEPFHDEQALSLSLKVAEEIDPGIVVIMGDFLDFPELSRFQTEPDTRQLIQPALDALSDYLHKLVESVSPGTPIYWLEGNHEMRLRNALLDLHAGALADVRPANENGPPQMSVERLLHLKELGIEYVAPYGTPLWLWDVMLHHGYIVRGSGGKTVSSILGSTTHHHVVGHIHRRELASRSIVTPEGRKEVHAMSPGCLASLKRGGVPAGRGRPGVDWQHGLGVIYRCDNITHFHCIPVLDGVCVVNGKVIS